jgi:nuclear pore complex protein Nup205
MEQIESFIDAFISNMPDVLRKLRLDEDEQRQLSSDHIHDLDLERFLVIISYAFEGRPEASLAFWSDPDSNLAGFLQWASRRASTPLVSAFCEMLQAISEDDECATAAHNFLLDEGSMVSGRLRRSQSLTWSQIFKELQFFASKLRDQPALHQSSSYRAGKQTEDQIETEPESAMMLESYLRLITRLCSESKAARTFLLKHPTFHLPDLIYQLASSDIPSRLRACAFTTLRSLLSDKSKETSDAIWISLDAWISSGYSPSTSMSRPSAPVSIASAGMEGIFQKIGAGFEEPHAFVQLLTALTSPCKDDDVLHDSLPFPENLGGSNRITGIDPYIDFAVGQVFARKTIEVSDPIHLRLLSLACLEFIATCLATFNEDLVIFANRSSIEVDGAIKTSNLAAYVRLHPFSRTMEWVFNDRVMNSLFASIHQDVAEVGNAAPDSPLILSLLHAINVVTLIIDLQPTYLDIVRPAINIQEDGRRRSPVSSAAFASFEDGVLNHLSVIADLGLYCGAGHAPLTVASLKLLEKFSTSPKLIAPSASNLLGRRERNKIIAALELNNESERIARSLVGEFDGDINMEQAQESSSYQIKMHILDFLNASLITVSTEPTIGHLLLGFHCLTDGVDIALNSPFANGVALFHSIMKLVIQCPVQDENGIISGWLGALRSNALQVLRTLWKSSLTSEITMTELRRHGFLTHLVVAEIIVTPSTMWDTTSTLTSCFNDFIRQRSILFQYAAAELRKVSQDQYPSMKQQICNTLLGATTLEDGSQIQNATIFDMADFMELDLNTPEMVSDISYFGDLDFSVCLKNSIDEPLAYDIKRVESLLILRRSELKGQGRLQALDEETAFENQAQTLILYLLEQNRATQFQATRLETMEAWTQVLLMLIQSGGIEGTNKLMVILEAILLVQSKLEKCSQQNLPEAQKLASLAKFLMFNIDFKSKPFEQNDVGHMANDRLFQLFSVSLRAIQSPIADASLKEILYNICYKYLTGMSDIVKDTPILRKHSTQSIKGSGERLVSIICDDAYAGDQTCRISALLLLSELVTLARREESTYIIDTLTRLNFISLVVDSLKNILDEIFQVRREGKSKLRARRTMLI